MTKPVIVKRSTKGSHLTFTELDNNFQNLDDATISLAVSGDGTVTADLNGTITLVPSDEISLASDNTAKTITVSEKIIRLYAYVHNAEGATINKGQPVYLFEATGDKPSVKLAYNTSDDTSAKTLGLAAETLTTGADGYIITQGKLVGVDTSAYSEGDTVYLGSTAGTLTATKPYAPNHLVYMGVIAKANAGQGEIYVRPQNGYELEELHNVNIDHNVTLTNKDYLVFNSSNSLWENKQLDIVNDTSPTLGGNLDVGGQSIISLSNGNIALAPNGTGQVVLDGVKWPQSDGTSGQVLKTDGAGNLSWTTNVSSSSQATSVDTDVYTSSSSDTTCYPLFANSLTGGFVTPGVEGRLIYNPKLNVLSVYSAQGWFNGPIGGSNGEHPEWGPSWGIFTDLTATGGTIRGDKTYAGSSSNPVTIGTSLKVNVDDPFGSYTNVFTDTGPAGTRTQATPTIIKGGTFTSNNAVTITDAIALDVIAPVASTNTTFTNTLALRAQGTTKIYGDLYIPYSSGNKELKFQAGASGHYVGFKAPTSASADKTWILPNADGTSNQFLKTDGSGNLSWGTSVPKVQTSSINTAFDTGLAMDNLNVRIHSVSGSSGQLQASAVSGSFSAYVTTLGNIAGNAVAGDTSSSGISFTAGTWTSCNFRFNLSSGGDVIEAHITDYTNDRVYRVTAIHGNNTTGGFLSIERML